MFISYVYAFLLSAVIDEWEKINVAQAEKIMAGEELTATSHPSNPDTPPKPCT